MYQFYRYLQCRQYYVSINSCEKYRSHYQELKFCVWLFSVCTNDEYVTDVGISNTSSF